MAGCADPVGTTSAGGRFLLAVWDAVEDRESYSDDAVHEIADGAVPVYTLEVWAAFVDLAAWSEDPSELGVDGSDMEQAAKVCLYLIAQRLASVLMEQAREAEVEDDDVR
jgi:hypothetical protein